MRNEERSQLKLGNKETRLQQNDRNFKRKKENNKKVLITTK